MPSVVGSIDQNRCRHSISAWPHNSALLESCFRLFRLARVRRPGNPTTIPVAGMVTPAHPRTNGRSCIFRPRLMVLTTNLCRQKVRRTTGFWQSKRGRRLEKTITANCRKSGGLTRRYNPPARWQQAQTALGNNMPGRSAECSGDAGAPCLGKRENSPRRVESRVH